MTVSTETVEDSGVYGVLEQSDPRLERSIDCCITTKWSQDYVVGLLTPLSVTEFSDERGYFVCRRSLH